MRLLLLMLSLPQLNLRKGYFERQREASVEAKEE